MIKKIIEWMHGRGRKIVSAIVIATALCIVISYFLVERDGKWGKHSEPIPTNDVDLYVGGDSLGPANTEKSVATGKSVSKNEPSANNMSLKLSNAGSQDITLGFAGDICLDEKTDVMKHMRKKGGISMVIDKRLIKKMKAYDYMFLNNEFSISDRGTPMPGKAFTFRARSKNVSILKGLGVDGVSLANNHVFDYGRSAFMDTLKYLKRADIKYVGAGKNSKEASKPLYINIKGKKIAVVSATRAEKYVLTPEAGKNSPGVFRTYDDKNYVKAIKKASKKADYVIAYVHWGTEYSTTLESAQVNQAKDYINAGADIVIGAHTHCIQGVGYYKNKPIFYSLGNYWFNSKTLYTTILKININSKGKITAVMQPCIQKGKETKLIRSKSGKKKFAKYINSISTNGRLDSNCNVMKKK